MTEPILKFQLIDPKTNHTWTSGLSWQDINQQIKELSAKLDAVNSNYYALKDRVWILETPQRQKAVLDFLKDRPKEEHSIKRHTQATYGDLQEMARLGLIVHLRHGTVSMYSLPLTVEAKHTQGAGKE